MTNLNTETQENLISAPIPENQEIPSTTTVEETEETFICGCCNEEFPISVVIKDAKEYEELCPTCREKHFESCQHCGDIHLTDDMTNTVDGMTCMTCLEDNYYLCESCGDYHHYDNCHSVKTSRRNEVIVCESCIDSKSRYFKCDSCSEYHDSHCIDSFDIHDTGETVCCYCFENGDYYYCDTCGNYVASASYNERNDTYQCDDCYEPSSGIIKGYHDSKGSFKFKGKGRRLLTPYIGFELEIESEQMSAQNLAEKHESLITSEFHIESDGSLSDGFEMITDALTYKNHVSRKESYDKIFKALSASGARSHDTETCGLHIHISRNGIEQKRINFLVDFVKHNQRTMEKLARRKQNNYCTYRNSNDDEQKSDRRNAVNTRPTKTIEFRLFRGTLKTETLFASIQLAYALYLYARKTDRLNNYSWSRFNEFLKGKYRFNELNEYLKTKGV